MSIVELKCTTTHLVVQSYTNSCLSVQSLEEWHEAKLHTKYGPKIAVATICVCPTTQHGQVISQTQTTSLHTLLPSHPCPLPKTTTHTPAHPAATTSPDYPPTPHAQSAANPPPASGATTASPASHSAAPAPSAAKPAQTQTHTPPTPSTSSASAQPAATTSSHSKKPTTAQSAATPPPTQPSNNPSTAPAQPTSTHSARATKASRWASSSSPSASFSQHSAGQWSRSYREPSAPLPLTCSGSCNSRSWRPWSRAPSSCSLVPSRQPPKTHILEFVLIQKNQGCSPAPWHISTSSSTCPASFAFPCLYSQPAKPVRCSSWPPTLPQR